MKVTLSLLIVSVLLLAYGVGWYVDANCPKTASIAGAGAAAGLAVFGGSMAVTGWIRMIFEQRK